MLSEMKQPIKTQKSVGEEFMEWAEKYYNNKKKRKSILPTPSLSVELYEKLNNLIMLGDEYDNLLFKMNCFQLMNLLLYVDYFNVDFRFADVRKIIQNIIPPKNKKEFDDLFNLFNNKDGKIRTVLFYADSTPIVRMIETL